MWIGYHVKCQLFLSEFDHSWIHSRDFRRIIKYWISWKSFLWEASCSMGTNGQTDRQTDMTKLIVAFRYFANAYRYTVFWDVTLYSVRNLGTLLRNMRPLSTFTPKIEHSSETSTPFLRNITSQQHQTVSRKEESISSYNWRDNLKSHICSAASPSTAIQAAKFIACIWEVPGLKLD